MTNLQEQIENAFSNHELFRPFTVWINCSSDLENFVNSKLKVENCQTF